MTDTISTIAEALPDYEVQRELGRGAMGTVYLGRHRRLDRVVAIKEIAGPLADDPDVRSRFLTEARVLAALDHPHIVPVYDYVEDRGRCLLIMEALGGGTVWERFQRDGLTLSASCSLLLSTCAAVEHAHRNGILHRDLKPENLLLSTSGNLKVADFGIAKVLDGGRTLATLEGSVLGTPAYMAPEQAEGIEVGPPADVYALGVILYEMLSGRLPHEADAPMALLVARITTDAPTLASVAPTVPPAICDVVDRAVARTVDERFQSASDLARALHRAAGETLGDTWLADQSAGGGAPMVAAPTLVPTPRSQPAPPTIAPSGTPVDDRVDEPVDEPVETIVRPTATAHPVGFGADLRRDDLVGIGTVVRPHVPIRLPLLATIALATLAVVLLLLAPNDPETSGDGAGALTIADQPVAGSDLVAVDLTEPIVITGLPATATTISFDVVTAGLPLASATAPVTDGVATVDVGLRGWLAGGVTEGHIDLGTTADGAVSTVIVPLSTERPWWQSGLGGAVVLSGLFALAGLESQSRRHQRGRVRTSSALAAAAGAALAFACGTVVFALVTDRVVTLGGWLAPAAAGAAAGLALTVTRARSARRRRIRWRKES
ncbi:MAG TPA: protein kinase [Ilumatobacteraceae bacterium]|nr:protein kinase [Ilumatobacteraceae bacterium]